MKFFPSSIANVSIQKPYQTKSLKADPVMRLASWARLTQKWYEKQTSKCFIAAGMGKPTYYLQPAIVEEEMEQWSLLAKQLKAPFTQKDPSNKPELAAITSSFGVIDYADPQGQPKSREIAAAALNKWYQRKGANQYSAENVLFTVGGAGGLNIIANTLREMEPNGYILSPSPYYSLYPLLFKNRFITFDILDKNGSKVTLEKIQSAYYLLRKQNKRISAFLICDPNNPLGTSIEIDEWKRIIKFFASLKEEAPYLIIDGAYDEMRFNKIRAAVFNISACFDEKIIGLRSATKAFSASGERMAILFTKNKTLMDFFVEQSIRTYGHSPVTSQLPYAKALFCLTLEEQYKMIDFYKEQVICLEEELKKIDADIKFRVVDSTFYAIADFSDFIGKSVEREYSIKISELVQRNIEKIETDEDISLYLMCKSGIMLAPLSYYGFSEKSGYLRITCSEGMKTMAELITRIKLELLEARKEKIISNCFGIEENKIHLQKMGIISNYSAFPKELCNAYPHDLQNWLDKKDCKELKTILLYQQEILEKLKYEKSKLIYSSFNLQSFLKPVPSPIASQNILLTSNDGMLKAKL